MNLETVKQILAEQQESVTLEFKKSTAQLKGAGETLCAFLNASGGIILIGITDEGKIVGQEVTDSTQRLIGNTLAQLSPEANIIVSYITTDNNRKIVALEAVAKKALQPFTHSTANHI